MELAWTKAFWRALRAFSFTIAAVSCGLGIVLAFADGAFDLAEAAAVMVAGLLFQAGVNLVNDFFEFKQRRVDDKLADLGIPGRDRTSLEWGIFAAGIGCLALIVPLGLWLTMRSGWPLLVVGALGVVAAYAYTGEPFNYKRRGLAVVLVFFLMGVLMIVGSHYAVAGAFSHRSVWISLPVSALVSLLLLSNELRDVEDDTRHGIRTLTVRIGTERAVRLYQALVIGAYGGALGLWLAGLMPHPWFVVASLVAVPAPWRLLWAPRDLRRPITLLTARLHLAFGAAMIATYAF